MQRYFIDEAIQVEQQVTLTGKSDADAAWSSC